MPRLWLSRSHWKTPTVILLAYIAALALAVGHHVFYSSLHRRDVDNYILDQEATIAIGTAFAFLVRTTLVIAVGTVYWQMFWSRLARQSFAISEVDSLAGALTSMFDLVDVRALRNSPDLGMIALLAWLLPFAAVFPPATLSVRSALIETNEQAHVPLPYLSGDAMAMWYKEQTLALDKGSSDSFHPVIDTYEYRKASLGLSRLAMTTATRGSIIDSQALYANSSYTIRFEAPAVQCQEVTPEILDPFIEASGCEILSGKEPEDSEGQADMSSTCWDLWYYVSWVPDSYSLVPFEADTIHNSSLPLEAAIANSRDGSGPDPALRSPFFGSFGEDALSIYIATRDLGTSQTAGSWSVLNCSLYNATYFVKMMSDANRRAVPSLLNITSHEISPYPSFELEANATLPASVKAVFNYVAIMESMGPIFLGTIFEESSLPFRKDFPYPQDDSRIIVQPAYLMQSMLPFTAQLLPMFSKPFVDETPNSNQWSVIDTRQSPSFNATIAVPAFATDASTFNRPLGPAIEQLFHNISMSFLSDPAFAKDSDEEILITLRQTRNIYFYRYKNLLLSYGLALGLSLLACMVGCMSIINNKVSYSNRFSTVLRVLSGGSVTSLVAPEDCKGRDPLPKYLAKARIDLTRGMMVGEENRGSEVELHQIFEQQSKTMSGKDLVQGLEEDTADSQQRLVRPDELSRRVSSEESQDDFEAQVFQLLEAHH
jgi:hypothetical protein